MKQNRKLRSIEEIIEKASSYITDNKNIEKINGAYKYAIVKYSNNEKELNVINHILSVTYILTGVYADTDTLIASLLHELDIDEYKEEISIMFNDEVVKLIQGVSKINKLNVSCDTDHLVEYNKKIIVGITEDVRVITIKLADRLDNMRNLFSLNEKEQKIKAKETLEIYAPIAHHLGINKIKSELEDLSLRYLKPDVFYDIAEKLNTTKVERDETVGEMLDSVSTLLTEHNIKHEIKGRSKSIYSIYKKLDKGKKFSDIYDLLALRILVNTKEECYLAIGIIHSKFKPFPKRFKDYIAMPKSNMYQSLHTTVFGINGYLYEIQVRTYEMNEIAENGVASHWSYKENKSAENLNVTEAKLQFFKQIIELNEDKMSSEDFVNSVKDEVLNNSIYCFTPKGDVIELKKGATPIDFAYKVHTRVGESMTGAIVNNTMVPLDYELQDNDIVKIVTSKTSTGPSKEWINIASLTVTKNKIKAFFTKNEREINIEKGKDLLERELRKRKISFNEFLSEENLKIIIDEVKVSDLDELYVSIGTVKYTPNSIINIIYKKDEEEVVPIKKVVIKNNENDIIVDGIDNVKVNIASCCNPLPGDSIVGYITKGNGISIHRNNCHNLDYLDDRCISVHFNEKTNNRYLTSIMIYSNTLDNKLIDIVHKLSSFDIKIDNINTISKNDTNNYEIDLYVKDLEQLNNVIKELIKNEFVQNVERLNR